MNRKQRRKRGGTDNQVVAGTAGEILRQATNALHRGEAEIALGACKMALAMQPNNFHAQGMAGVAAFQAGRHKQAARFLNRAVRIAPDWVDGWFNLGTVMSSTGDYRKARRAFQEANKLAPRNSAILVSLAAVSLVLGPIEEALEYAKKAIEFDRESADAWVNLGSIQRIIGASQEAAAAFRMALKMAPNDFGILIESATFFEETNELGEMAVLVARLERDVPRDSRVVLLGAKLARRGERFDNALERLETLDPKRISPIESQAYHFELGRIFDRLHRYDEAWNAFVEGNQAALKAKPKNIDGTRALKKAEAIRAWLKVTDTAPWVHRAREHDDGKAPVFLVGFPRSGTTLLDQILNSHPRLVTIEEKPTVHHMLERLRLANIDYPGFVGALPSDLRQDLAKVYWAEAEKYARVEEGQILVDKIPLVVQHAALISQVFPNARFLVALRHPLDCCLSSFMQEFRLNDAMANFLDLEATVRFYESVMGGWLVCRERFPISYMESRYEDIVDDLETRARAIFEFIGVEWNPAVLDFAITARSKPNISTPSYYQVVEGLYRRARYRWKRYEPFLANPQRRLEPFARAFGYGDDEKPTQEQTYTKGP